MSGIIGKNIGMTSMYDESGFNVPCSIIEAGPCIVLKIKTKEKDRYDSCQLGFDKKKYKNTNKPLLFFFNKFNSTPKKKIFEFPIKENIKSGNIIKLNFFHENELVNITGISKGKGFQGVVKRHGFSGVGERSHGQHNRSRAPGSIGAGSDPSRVFKGTRMAGRMGNKKVTLKNRKILKIDLLNNFLIIKGSVPGAKNSYLIIKKTQMKITIFNNSGLETGIYLKVNNFFIEKENNNILFLEINRYLSAQRQGTNKSKERCEITGSTKKIQRQKGSGNARKGDIKNPIFRSGGRIFGPKPRNFNRKINNKSKFLAKKTILNFKLRTNKIKIIEDFKFNIIKTKLVFKILNRLNFNLKKSLIIYNNINYNFYFSSRNLNFINFLSINELNSFELANSYYLLFFESAIKKILKL